MEDCLMIGPITAQCISCPGPSDGKTTECQSCREKRRQKLADLQRAKRDRGECSKCVNPASEGLTLCVDCCEKNQSRKKRLRDDRRGLGLCIRCGEGCLKGKTLCSSCAKKENAAAVKAREMRAEECVCIGCGSPIETGYARCIVCLEKQRKHFEKRRVRIVEAGLCRRCARVKPENGANFCYVCSFKTTAGSWLGTANRWSELEELFITQGKVCPYLGLPLEIGVNAEIDHIVPRSKGGTSDIENLQWVHVWSNLIKGDDLESEFLAKWSVALPIMMEKEKTRG